MSVSEQFGAANREGVYTAVPGTENMGWRYSSRAAVPLLDRWRAQQIGRAGFWYVKDIGSSSGYTPTITERAAVAVERVNEVTGLDRGLLGIVGSIVGIPPLLVLIILLFLGWSLLSRSGAVTK